MNILLLFNFCMKPKCCSRDLYFTNRSWLSKTHDWWLFKWR